MTVYRIGHPKYIYDVSGKGSSLKGGRWNLPGAYMLYTFQTSSLAILENLGHILKTTVAIPYVLTSLEISDDTVMTLEQIGPTLSADWQQARGVVLTRRIGTDWLNSRQSPVLRVPSIHNLIEYNYLLNPRHPELHLQPQHQYWYLYNNTFLRSQ